MDIEPELSGANTKAGKLSTKWLLLINWAIIIPPVVFFKLGALLDFYLLPFYILILVPVNYECSTSVRNLCLLDFSMVLATTLSATIPGLLYFHFVCDDGLGRMLQLIETIAVFSIATICAIVSIIVKYKKANKKS